VGIGTASPGYELDVQGGQINSAGGYCINGTNCITAWPTASGGGSGTVTSVTAGTGLSGGTITTTGTVFLNLGSANTWTVPQTFSQGASFSGGIWNSSGSVGIGTAAPSEALDIVGTEGTTPAINTAVAQGATVALDDTGTGTGSGGALLFGAYSGAWRFAAIKGFATNGGNNSQGDIVFSTRPIATNATLTEAMRIQSSGFVGIGTSSPQHLLHVLGTIGATEVIVSSNGADYVFQPDYHLSPLTEVATYIEQNHHLPGIPSAKEVQVEGVNLGDMQTKLLAKIEELTLHMIQLDERNARLEQQNQELQKRIAHIEQR
jgi:hypothetical protein